MYDILTVATGVVLGEFIWAIILSILLYISIKTIIRRIKNKIANAGVIFSVGGTSFFRKKVISRTVTPTSVKNFMNYSGDVAKSVCTRFKR